MLRNSEERYGVISKSLHWCIALLIIGLIGLGWYMVNLTYYDRWYHTSLSTHKALGMLVLLLALMNIAWRAYSQPPALVSTIKPWERMAARLIHACLFIMMIAIPVTGYAISTSAGDPVTIFGWFDIPALFRVTQTLRDFAIDLHYYLAYGAAGLVILHALAALKHQFIYKDGTLSKML